MVRNGKPGLARLWHLLQKCCSQPLCRSPTMSIYGAWPNTKQSQFPVSTRCSLQLMALGAFLSLDYFSYTTLAATVAAMTWSIEVVFRVVGFSRLTSHRLIPISTLVTPSTSTVVPSHIQRRGYYGRSHHQFLEFRSVMAHQQ